MRDENENLYDLAQYRSRRRGGAQRPREKGDFLIRVICAQAAVFALLSLLLFILCKRQTDSFFRLRELYNAMSEKDLSARELADAFKNAAQNVTERAHRRGVRLGRPVGEGGGTGGEELMGPGVNASFSPVVVTREIVPPVRGARVSSKFGYRVDPFTGGFGFHTGVDLAAPEGAPIAAAYCGRVAEAAQTPVRGKYLILEHSDSFRTVYCHCRTLLVKEGDTVRAGETIAEVGSTGRATGPHLHFELRLYGIRCDPLWVLDMR